MKTRLIAIASVLLLLISGDLFSQNNQPVVVASGLPRGVTSFAFHNQDIYFTTTNSPHIIDKVNSSINNQTYEVVYNNVYTPFGLLGRKCSNTNLIDNKIDINQLISGVYTINQYSNDSLIISKKIIKK